MDLKEFIYNLIFILALILGVIIIIVVTCGPFAIIGYFIKEIVSIIVSAL